MVMLKVEPSSYTGPKRAMFRIKRQSLFRVTEYIIDITDDQMNMLSASQMIRFHIIGITDDQSVTLVCHPRGFSCHPLYYYHYPLYILSSPILSLASQMIRV